MKIFNKVAVIGLGLIGGSIALCLKKQKLCGKIVGVSLHKDTILFARKNKIVDECSQGLDIIRGADLVILATPVDVILKLAPQLAKLLSKDCLVTDVGSTKRKIVRQLSRIFPNFVGSHPLAGSEKRGIKNSHSGLFIKSLCIVTPQKNTDKRSLSRIVKLWRTMGADTNILSPSEHDKILSYVSHLPHIAAFALMESVPDKYLKYAAGSLRDTTRIAASPSNIWTDIFLSNKQDILKGINLFLDNLGSLKQAILKNDKSRIKKILGSAKKKREGLI
jgi:prephenate dehydrogenase